MHYEFTKMQSLGNDFIVLDGVRRKISLTAAAVRALADRHFGIGCDQVLLAESDPDGEADFLFRVFNHDGGEVEQCGNGARCFARFLHDAGLTEKSEIRVRTLADTMTLIRHGDETVTAHLGVPEFEPARIPFVADASAEHYPLEVDGRTVSIDALAVGNPHAVLDVVDVDDAPVATLGPAIEGHARFPARVNVGFRQIVDRQHVRLRVFERGVGETLGCGSGACAAVVAGIRRGELDRQVRVSLPGGSATVVWADPGAPVALRGSAHTVFSGEIDLADGYNG